VCPSPGKDPGTGVEIGGVIIFVIANPLFISGLVIFIMILLLLLCLSNCKVDAKFLKNHPRHCFLKQK